MLLARTLFASRSAEAWKAVLVLVAVAESTLAGSAWLALPAACAVWQLVGHFLYRRARVAGEPEAFLQYLATHAAPAAALSRMFEQASTPPPAPSAVLPVFCMAADALVGAATGAVPQDGRVDEVGSPDSAVGGGVSAHDARSINAFLGALAEHGMLPFAHTASFGGVTLQGRVTQLAVAGESPLLRRLTLRTQAPAGAVPHADPAEGECLVSAGGPGTLFLRATYAVDVTLPGGLRLGSAGSVLLGAALSQLTLLLALHSAPLSHNPAFAQRLREFTAGLHAPASGWDVALTLRVFDESPALAAGLAALWRAHALDAVAGTALRATTTALLPTA